MVVFLPNMQDKEKGCNKKVCCWGVREAHEEGQKDMDESQGRQGVSGMGCYGGPRHGRIV